MTDPILEQYHRLERRLEETEGRLASERALREQAERERDAARESRDRWRKAEADRDNERQGLWEETHRQAERATAAEERERALRGALERTKDRLARVLARAVVVMRDTGNPTWNRRRGGPGGTYHARGYVWSGKRYSWRSPKQLAARAALALGTGGGTKP